MPDYDSTVVEWIPRQFDLGRGSRCIVVRSTRWASITGSPSSEGFYEAKSGRIREDQFNIMNTWDESQRFKTFDEAKNWCQKRVEEW